MLEIYADVFILQNMALDYTILSLAAKLSSTSVSALRIAVGSAVGAILSLVYILLSAVIKMPVTAMIANLIISLCIIIKIGYGFKSFYTFLRQILSIIIVSMAIGGLMIVWQTGFNPGIKPINGVYIIPNTIFWDICWVCIIAYVILRIFSEEVISRLIYHKAHKNVKVVLGDKTAFLNGFVDTGNMLCDPFSGAPVALAELDSLRSILPPLLTSDVESVCSIQDMEGIKNKICLIPYKTAGSEEGIFTGFRPDIFEVEGRGIIPGAIVGICKKQLSDDGSFNVIIGSTMV